MLSNSVIQKQDEKNPVSQTRCRIYCIDMETNWEQVRIDAAISAIQGVMESGRLGMILEIDPQIIAMQAVRVADALVEELKK
jgi:hypothetical protein